MTGTFYYTAFAKDDQSGLLIYCIIFVIGFEFGLGTLGFPYIAEICHPTALGVALTSNWFWSLVVSFFYPYLANDWLASGYANLIFAVVSFVGVLFFYGYFLETRGKTQEQIKRMFLPKKDIDQEYENLAEIEIE